ncbi:di-heme oxidoredictase family protein [Limnobacter sp.]|uniref:di-heme oxidoredictase family protein n=1 Tax=Limnobacter sp. TaxID=2003368 RepID=UPI0025C70F9F|nr:di-heme oxidoredictase family protein [Limnobacter sp.]
MIKNPRHVATLAALGLLLGACNSEDHSSLSSSSSPTSIQAAGQTQVDSNIASSPAWSAPVDGLTPAQLARFEQGKAMFEKVFTPSNGLGAVFNAQSCVECHGQPAVGGTDPAKTIQRFTTLLAPHFAAGLVTQADGAPHVHARSVATEFPDEVPGCVLGGELVPPHAMASTTRVTPHLFGIGLLENIPDTTLIQNGLASAKANPEVSGRPGLMFPGGVNDLNAADQLIGRLGARGFVADVQSFTQGAFSTELGIATFHPLFAAPVRPKGNLATADCTPFVGEAVSLAETQATADFQRWLAPPPKPELTGVALRGQQLFDEIQCSSCHTPMMKTSPMAPAPLNDREVWLYSDLLLHDMGAALADNAPEGLGLPTEWKTAPLWGVGQTEKPLLHDGRAGRDFAKAIDFHGGEAEDAKRRFQNLSPADQAALIAFLKKL